MRRPGRRASVRRTLLVAVLAAVAVTWLATAVVSYFDARHELDELLDAHLAQSASLLVAQAGRESEAIDLEHSPELHRYGRRVVFQFWENGTVLRLHSASAPNTRLSARTEGFSDVEIDGRAWRVFSGWDADRRYLVQVGERRAAREEIVAKIAKNLLWPLAVALPVLGLLVWLGIARALRPLRLVSRQVERRAPDNLAELDVSGAPAEVAPLVHGLNRLFGRVRASMESERRFTADAAHELRTPLAALRAQAQVARGAGTATERDRALANVIAGCDRAAHLVDQLLTLARLEPEGLRPEHARCDLAELAREAVADVVPQALARTIDVDLAAEAPVAVRGDGRLLRILLRNVLDNAIRYSPAATAIHVRVGRRDGSAFVSVADEGPGVPREQRARLGQRFFRMQEAQAPGSGLGLSIALRIAEVHGAVLAFDAASNAGGLVVTLTFAHAAQEDARGA
ncbi:MAG: sensor histidine kinase N-terminal domain-containing protein [Burkholderiales bacterium]|nr:sensor histidine kinase N-terminal domain-containing protein [Burkholderiales bacterium]